MVFLPPPSFQPHLFSHSALQIRRENLAYMGNKNTNLDYFVPQITVFDHRGCSRAPKEYAGALAVPPHSHSTSSTRNLHIRRGIAREGFLRALKARLSCHLRPLLVTYTAHLAVHMRGSGRRRGCSLATLACECSNPIVQSLIELSTGACCLSQTAHVDRRLRTALPRRLVPHAAAAM